MVKKSILSLFSLLIVAGIIGITINKLNTDNLQNETKQLSSINSKTTKSPKIIISNSRSTSSSLATKAKPDIDVPEAVVNEEHTAAFDVQTQMVAPFNQSLPKIVYLTFDDGPSTIITNQILNTLAKYKIKATFFVVGNQIGQNTAPILKRIHDEGHGIGIHSFDHTYTFEKTGNVQQTAWQYQSTLNAIHNVLGPDFSTTAWRYPGGHMSWSKTLAGPDNYLKENNLAWIDWNAAVGDALGSTSPRDIKGQLDYLDLSIRSYGPHNATVVLLHDSNPHQLTLNALPEVIEYFQQRGYQFGSMQ